MTPANPLESDETREDAPGSFKPVALGQEVSLSDMGPIMFSLMTGRNIVKATSQSQGYKARSNYLGCQRGMLQSFDRSDMIHVQTKQLMLRCFILFLNVYVACVRLAKGSVGIEHNQVRASVHRWNK